MLYICITYIHVPTYINEYREGSHLPSLPCAFGALTLLVWQQEEHLARKKTVMRCWRGYMSGARCK